MNLNEVYYFKGRQVFFFILKRKLQLKKISNSFCKQNRILSKFFVEISHISIWSIIFSLKIRNIRLQIFSRPLDWSNFDQEEFILNSFKIKWTKVLNSQYLRAFNHYICPQEGGGPSNENACKQRGGGHCHSKHSHLNIFNLVSSPYNLLAVITRFFVSLIKIPVFLYLFAFFMIKLDR